MRWSPGRWIQSIVLDTVYSCHSTTASFPGEKRRQIQKNIRTMLQHDISIRPTPWIVCRDEPQDELRRGQRWRHRWTEQRHYGKFVAASDAIKRTTCNFSSRRWNGIGKRRAWSTASKCCQTSDYTWRERNAVYGGSCKTTKCIYEFS